MNLALISGQAAPAAELVRRLRSWGHAVQQHDSDTSVPTILRDTSAKAIIVGPVADDHAAVCREIRHAGIRLPMLAVGLVDTSAATRAGADEAIATSAAHGSIRAWIDAVNERAAAMPKVTTGSRDGPAPDLLGFDSESVLALLDSYPHRISIKNANSQFTWANSAVLAMLGLDDVRQLAGRTDADFLPAADARHAIEEDRQVVESGEPVVNSEWQGPRDGRDTWMLTTKFPVKDPNGRVSGLISVTRDITDLKLAQLELQRSEARFRGLVASLPDLLALVRDEALVFLNDAGVRMLGLEHSDDAIGRSLLEFVNPEDQATVRERLAAAADGVPGRAPRVRLIKPEGRELIVEITTLPSQQHGERVVQLFARDSTPQARAEAARRASEERWRAVVTNAPDAILLVDRLGTILFANRPAAGYALEETVGRPFDDFVPEGTRDAARGALLSVLATGAAATYESPATAPNGQTRWIVNRIGPVEREGGVTGAVIIATDITELRESEHELRSSEAQWRALVDNAADQIVMLDRDGTIQFTNRTHSDIGRERIIGRSAFDFIAPAYRDQVRADIERVFRDGESVESESEAIDEGGHTAWIASRIAPVWKDNAVASVVVINTDVSARRETEQALRRREAQYRTLAANIPDHAVLLFDEELRVTAAEGEGLDRICGPDVEGQELSTSLPMPIWEQIGAHCAATLQGRRGGLMADHEDHRLMLQAVPVRNERGDVYAGMLVVRDITERADVEAALRAATAEFEAIFRSMPNAVMVAGPGGHITTLNPAFSELFGYRLHEITGRSTRMLYADARDYEPADVVAATTEDRGAHGHEARYIRADGREFIGEAVGTPVVDSTGATLGFLIMIRDVTDQRRVDIELRARARQQAEVATLGQRALAGEDVQDLLRQACEIVANTLGVDFCDVLEHQPERDRFVLVAGAGWPDAAIGTLTLSTEHNSPVRLALEQLDPVVVPDVQQDPRFEAWEPLRANGVASSVCVLIQGPTAPYGVFCAHTTSAREFSNDDFSFLQLVANVVAAAIERKEAESIISHMAFHDPLTGLPNRTLFDDRFRMALAHAQRNNDQLAVLFVDLDSFKRVNDSYGHAIGDRVLPEVAKRLSDPLRGADTIARVGGDEFVVIVSELHSENDAQACAQRLLDSLRPPVIVDGNEIHVSASIGVAVYPADGDSIVTLLTRADQRMYAAKQAGHMVDGRTPV